MTGSKAATITDQQLRQWDQEGYLLLRQVIPIKTIHRTRRALGRTVDRMIASFFPRD